MINYYTRLHLLAARCLQLILTDPFVCLVERALPARRWRNYLRIITCTCGPQGFLRALVYVLRSFVRSMHARACIQRYPNHADGTACGSIKVKLFKAMITEVVYRQNVTCAPRQQVTLPVHSAKRSWLACRKSSYYTNRRSCWQCKTGSACPNQLWTGVSPGCNRLGR